MLVCALAGVAPAAAQRPPRVALHQTSDPVEFVYPGQQVTFTWEVTNRESRTLENVEVKATFDPAELTYDRPLEPDIGPDLTSGVSPYSLTWAFEALPPDATESRTWRAEVTDVAFAERGIDVSLSLTVDGQHAGFVPQTLRPAYTIHVSTESERLDAPVPATRIQTRVEWGINTDLRNFRITAELLPEEGAVRDALGEAVSLQPCAGDDAEAAETDADSIAWAIGAVEPGAGARCYDVVVHDSLNAGSVVIPTLTTVRFGETSKAELPGRIEVATPVLDIRRVELQDLEGRRIGSRVEPGADLRAAVFLYNDPARTAATSEADVTVTLDRQVAETNVRSIMIDGDLAPNSSFQRERVLWRLGGPLLPGEQRKLSYEFTVSEGITVDTGETRTATLTVAGRPITVSAQPLTSTITPVRIDRLVEWAKVLGFVLGLFVVAALLPRFLQIPSRSSAAGMREFPGKGSGQSFEPTGNPTGLALSGGGYRAGAFALGVMLYLVDSGYHRHIGHVSSVSGGSITSAFVGSRTRFGQTDLDAASFWQRVKPLARQYASESIIKWDWRLAVVVTAYAGLFLLGWLVLDVFATLPRGITAGVALVLATMYGIFQTLSHGAYARLDVLLQNAKLKNLASAGSLHVLCATDLDSGEHLYFAPSFVFHEDHPPRLFPRDYPLARAVQASAAFPGVFAAVTVRPNHDFEAEVDTRKRPPRTLRVMDGGVHDNLGATWLTGYEQFREDEENKLPDDHPLPTLQIVVNAGAPASKDLKLWERVPVWFDIRNFGRAMEILHQSNSAARAADRENAYTFLPNGTRTGTVMSIKDDPYRLVRDIGSEFDKWPAPYVAGEAHQAQLRGRARTLEAKLNDWHGMPPDQWERIAAVVSPGIRTHLKGLGEKDAVTLITHGYAVAMVQTCLDLGWEPPETLPGRADFEKLVAEVPPTPEPTGVTPPAAAAASARSSGSG